MIVAQHDAVIAFRRFVALVVLLANLLRSAQTGKSMQHAVKALHDMVEQLVFDDIPIAAILAANETSDAADAAEDAAAVANTASDAADAAEDAGV